MFMYSDFDNGGFFIFMMIIFIWLVIYFLPTIIATIRKNSSTFAIFALNFLLGWSFIAWVIALIWAFSGDSYSNIENKLKNLYSLKEKGLISEEEFEIKKDEIINSILR